MSSYKGKNKTEYNRAIHDKNNYYTKTSKQLVEDSRLNALQVGIMVYILSQSDEWVVNKSYILDVCGFGKSSFNKHWKGLVDLGYIEMKRIQGGIKWTINEIPSK